MKKILKSYLSISCLALTSLTLATSCANANSNTHATASSEISAASNNADRSSYIPKGYKLLEEIKGDLNKDGIEDYVLFVKNTDPENIDNLNDDIVDLNRRGMIVLFKKGNGYEEVLKNLECFSSEEEDGGAYMAPELYITIEKNLLYVNYSHGRNGSWKYTFRYQDNGFKLIGYDNDESNGPTTIQETSINFSTKKKLTRKNLNPNIDTDKPKFKDIWTTVNIKELIDLNDVKDFDALSFYDL